MASAFSGVRWLLWGTYVGKGLSLSCCQPAMNITASRKLDILPAVSNQAIHLQHAHTRRPVRNLAVQIRRLDDVPVHDAQGAHACAGDVRRRGASQATGPDDEDPEGLESFLAF